MNDVIIWGRIQQFGPDQFLAIGSCISELQGLPSDADVLTKVSDSLAEAREALSAIVLELGLQARSRGDRVVDVESD